MKTRILNRCTVLLWLLAIAGSAAAAQTVDPAQRIRSAQRTKIAPAHATPIAPASRLRQPSRRNPAPQRSNIESFIARAQQLPAQVAAREESQQSPAVTPTVAPNRISEAPVLSAPAIGVATLLALVGTAGTFLLVRRITRRSFRSIPAPVMVTPFDRPASGADRSPAVVEPSVRVEDDEPESVPGFARGRGEIELAQTIERLKRRTQAPTEPRSGPRGRKKQPRGAEAARRLRRGKGELELAIRLEELRKMHPIVEERQ